VNDFIDEVNKDEDFVKTTTIGNIQVTVGYKPAEYMALSEMRSKIEGQTSISAKEFNETVNGFRQSAYFLLKIGATDSSDVMKIGITDRVSYANRLNDLTFNSGNHAYFLTNENDTIRASIFDLQRSFGYSNDLSILFAFPRRLVDEEKLVRFVYEDVYFGNEKPIFIEFEPKKLTKKLPEIILNSNP
jgi:hypothetical protein